jgi:hypothetical protein
MKNKINNIYTRTTLLLFIVLAVASCKKSYFYDGINTNPTQLQSPIPSNLLAGIIASEGYEWGGDASRFTSIFMQQTNGVANQSFSANRYAVSSDDVDNMWAFGLYGGIMNNANAMIQLADKAGQAHYAAVARILQANALGLTTDLWGDIPYSQAFLGNANLQPKYDSQQQIYTTIDGLLTTAIADLAKTESSAQPGSEDVLYGGDLDKWAKFAHSLRAKFFIHLAKVDASNYAKAITEAKLGFASSDDDAVVQFAGSSVTTQAPWYQFNTQRVGDIGFTGYIYDLLTADKDPRLAVYRTAKGGLGTLYGGPNSPVYLMSYDELQFVIAEASFQTGNTADAAIAYTAGVTANLNRTVKSTDYEANVAKSASNITLNDIMTQKYIANFLNPEVWTDWRRTALPALTPASNGALNGQIPRSLLYPSSEVRYNPNTPANTGMLRRVYWDKQ